MGAPSLDMRLHGKRYHVDEKNFDASLKRLQSAIKPGTPVLIRNLEYNHAVSFSNNVQDIVFLSGGSIKDAVLKVKQGKRAYGRAHVSPEDPASYNLVATPHPLWGDSARIHLFHSSQEKQYNEGTFSPAGGYAYYTQRGSGTQLVVVGDEVQRMMPDVLHAVRFVSDAVYFKLPSDYLPSSNDITAFKEDKGQQRMLDAQIHQLACAKAARQLVGKAASELLQDYPDGVYAQRLDSSPDNIPRLRAEGFPVDSQDFALIELGHPRRILAFVKADHVTFRGEMYVLPTRPECRKVIEHAFSSKMVETIYPHGIRQS